jgi:hypothetical protein
MSHKGVSAGRTRSTKRIVVRAVAAAVLAVGVIAAAATAASAVNSIKADGDVNGIRVNSVQIDSVNSI